MKRIAKACSGRRLTPLLILVVKCNREKEIECMEGEAPIWILVGVFGLICGIGLAFVEVGKVSVE